MTRTYLVRLYDCIPVHSLVSLPEDPDLCRRKTSACFTARQPEINTGFFVNMRLQCINALYQPVLGSLHDHGTIEPEIHCRMVVGRDENLPSRIAVSGRTARYLAR